MDLELGRHLLVDAVEEVAELDGSVSSMNFANDLAGLRQEG
jgi:hypothetical protein